MAPREEAATADAEVVAPAHQEAREQLGGSPELTTQRYLDRIRSHRPDSSEEQFRAHFQSAFRQTARQQKAVSLTTETSSSTHATQASVSAAAKDPSASSPAGGGAVDVTSRESAPNAHSTRFSGHVTGIMGDEQPQPIEPPSPTNAARRWRLVRDEARGGELEVYMPLAVNYARSCPPPMQPASAESVEDGGPSEDLNA